MSEYLDKEKVISTLENTAKYYEMPDADVLAVGIHYGLLHGVDNIVDNVPIEDVIPIPAGATNGDVIKLMFPSDAKELDMSNSHLMYAGLDYIKEFRKEWWNAPFRKEVDENESNN